MCEAKYNRGAWVCVANTVLVLEHLVSNGVMLPGHAFKSGSGEALVVRLLWQVQRNLSLPREDEQGDNADQYGEPQRA